MRLTYAAQEQASDALAHATQIPNPGRNWERHAACRDVDPDLFHPVGYRSGADLLQIEEAAAVCSWCPVRWPCRERRYRLRAVGVWAGVAYPDEYAGGPVPMRPITSSRPCVCGCNQLVPSNGRAKYATPECRHRATVGTPAGRDWHVKVMHEKPCDPCRIAYNRQTAEIKAAAKSTRAELVSASRPA